MKVELAERAGYLLVLLLFLIALLHTYWALGGRWGLQTAIGEGSPFPHPFLIWAVVVALMAAVLTVLGRIGWWSRGIPFWLFRVGIWALVVVLVGAALINFGGKSRWDRFVFGPIALFLALLAVIVARYTPERG